MTGKRTAVWVALGLAAALAAGVFVTSTVVRATLGRLVPAAIPHTRVGETMPPFQLTDLQGRTWRADDLTGKVAFISVWATWCPPCRQELPHLQDLWERVKGRGDVVLLAMNVDEEPGKVRPFMDEHGYTFPVLFAHDFVRTQLATVGIPRLWVLDGRGVWRVDEIGFRSDGDWTERALTMIGSAGPSGGTAGTS
ncbi:MAG: TlpA family protein disulfide reductase [Acidobacteriota bacterium]